MFRGAIDGGTVWWVGPTYKMVDNSQIWHHLKRATQNAWVDKSEIDRRIVLPGGGSVTVRSADDPDSLRGPGLDGVVIDEAAYLNEEAWLSAIRPALADRQGWAMLMSTPNGRNWFFDAFENSKTRDDWQSWQLPSSQNPLVTATELEEIKEKVGPRRFAQEFEAEFLEIEGAMWPSHYFEGIWADRWPENFHISTIAIDPSMGASETSDYSAIVFAGLTGGKVWVDADIERRPPGQIVEDGIKMFQRYKPDIFGIESVAFQAVLCDLFDAHCELNRIPPLPIAMVGNSNQGKKEVRIQRLDPYLANGQIRLKAERRGCGLLLDQLMMFPCRGEHDDGPDALEMAIRLLNHIAGRVEVEEEMVRA